MTRATLTTCSLSARFVLLVLSAYAISNDADSYAAPTLKDLCEAQGWPDNENNKLAFRACHAELKHGLYRISKDGFWKPQLGHLRLSSVKHSDITTALKNGGRKSGKTGNNKLSMLRSMFDLAVSDGLIPSNPCGNIGNASWQKKKPDPFTIEEAQKIVASVLERYP